jgi:hypothetical protein
MITKIILFILILSGTALSSPVPLLLWSGQRAFLNDHEQVAETLNFNDVHTTVKKLLIPSSSPTRKTSPLDSYIYQGYGSPEVLVAFIAGAMGSSELAHAGGGYSQAPAAHALQGVLSGAQSILTAPYVFPEDERLSDDLVHTMLASPKSQVIASQLTKGQSAGCDSLLNHLQENQKIFSNDVSDLVLVQFSLYDTESAECMKRVMDYVKTQTDRHLGLLSADQSSKHITMAFPSTEEVFGPYRPTHVPRRLLQTTSNSTQPTGPQYITSTILFGLLLGIGLLFILWQGLYCLLTIETPVRYSYQYPTHSMAKEY